MLVFTLQPLDLKFGSLVHYGDVLRIGVKTIAFTAGQLFDNAQLFQPLEISAYGCQRETGFIA